MSDTIAAEGWTWGEKEIPFVGFSHNMFSGVKSKVDCGKGMM